MAPKADLRPFQMAALCSALWLMRTSRARSGLAMLGDDVEQVGDLVVGALDLDDQQRLDVERDSRPWRTPRRPGSPACP